jgi:acetylcholinesterase
MQFFKKNLMSGFTTFLLFTFLSSYCVGAALSVSNTGPVIKLSYGSFQGNATGDLVQFLGMPFAAPPYAS